MNKNTLYPVWAGFFILCGGLGFIPEPQGFLRFLMIALSLGFFLPPALLLYGAWQKKDRFTLKLIRNLALTSLILTVVVLIFSVMSITASEALGNFLHVLLVLISVPMVCGQYWVMSLFCWACLLLVSGKLLKKK